MNKYLLIDEKTRNIIEWIVCIIIAIIIALVVRHYIGTPTIVQQKSMFPTLKQDERLWISRWGRTTKKLPKKGDIITFEAPSITNVKQGEIDMSNPVAIYNYNPKGLSGFVYNVLELNKMSYIKRVIGVPGDHIQIKDGSVYVNGEKLQEEYIQSGIVTDTGNGIFTDVIVPENTVYVLGDNRPKSTDSRCFGCVPLEKIEGKVIIRFWPLSLWGEVK